MLKRVKRNTLPDYQMEETAVTKEENLDPVVYNPKWSKKETTEKYAYLNILGNPLTTRKRNSGDKLFNDQFDFYYQLMDHAENMIEFQIYYETMIRFLNKYDCI